MKLNVEKPVNWDKLKYGDTFMYHNRYFMKVCGDCIGGYASVDLETGIVERELHRFSGIPAMNERNLVTPIKLNVDVELT